jgi:hypothetical protein
VIRKYTYREDWDYSGELEWTAGPDRLRLHVDHCIEALRIALMCTADVTPILLSIDPAEPLGASPDFETLHRCRNINSLLDWATSEGLLFKLTNRTMSNKTFL